MELGLGGKVAFVSGSTRGIGLAIAEEFLSEGARVVITGRDAAGVREASMKLADRNGTDRVVGLVADFSAGDDAVSTVMRRAHEQWGALDIVVANVGGGQGISVLEADAGEWARMIGLNLISASLTVRHAAALFPASGGSIVSIASIAGMEALPAPASYTASKAGVIALGKSLSRQLAKNRIRVNVVSPGNVLHPGGSWEQRLKQDPEAIARYVESDVPLRRFGAAREIATVVVFLASDRAAGFITGANVVVDGGQTRGF